VPIPGDQRVRHRHLGESDEIVVLGVVWHHARWVDWIIEPDAFVGEAVRKAIRLLPSDVVLPGDPRMQ
jgi:hypothetical protein